MAIKSTTLRPGLLVSLKTSLTGNVTYDKLTIEATHETEGGALRAKWETTKTVQNAEEQARADKARNKARSIIAGVCAHSAFGYLCPEADADKLESAIADARAVADAFNAGAELTRLGVYVITGKIAADDVQAVKAINSELSDLLARMAEGVKNIDVKTIRDAADRAVQVGRMLPIETQARAQLAIDAARKAARQIVAAGEAAAQEVDAAALRRIVEARTSFLDLDGARPMQEVEQDARAIELEPAAMDDSAPVMQAATESAPQLDLI